MNQSHIPVNPANGNSYLDFMAGVCVASLGHSHPRWVSALSQQASQLTIGSFTSQARVALLKLMASILPGGTVERTPA